MFSFFKDIDTIDDSLITLDTVNTRLKNKRKLCLLLACSSLFFLGDRYLIDHAVKFLVSDTALSNQLSLGLYLVIATSALYLILSILQEISNLMSQRDEISKLLM
jgi:hypothetical protein